jgi:hypothetical protein
MQLRVPVDGFLMDATQGNRVSLQEFSALPKEFRIAGKAYSLLCLRE